MENLLIRKLSNYMDLLSDERQELDSIVQETKSFAIHSAVVREGDPTNGVYLILTGWACRYKVLPDGQRQITAYLIPGDMCNQQVFMLKRMDHSIGTITPAAVSIIPADRMIALTGKYPHIERALRCSTLVDEAIMREWAVSLGRRNALERVAHLICEMFMRVRAVELHEGTSFYFPVTQAELADSVGLTPVHAGRTLKELREQDLISFEGRRLTILNFDRLASLSMFNASYLHLGQGAWT
jgi:CRP-like cAMP-binding protein